MNKLKKFVPPILLDLKKELVTTHNGWFGNFKSWEEATDLSSGYDSDKILNKVVTATQAVLRGDAEFERDSVLFYEKDYFFHIATALLWVATQKNSKLYVLDFGGSLGSTYFQNRMFLQKLDVVWNIVEQQKFVEAGKKHFQDERLKFYYSIGESLKNQIPDIALLSSVLAYIPTPYDLLDEIFSYNIEYLIIDKHPFIEAHEDRLTIQKVPSEIYKASYPAWFFSKKEFINYLTSKYEVLYDYNCKVPNNINAEFTCIVARLK